MSASDNVSDTDLVGAIVARVVAGAITTAPPWARQRPVGFGIVGTVDPHQWAIVGRLCAALQRSGLAPQDLLKRDGGRAMMSVLDLVLRQDDAEYGVRDVEWALVAAHARDLLAEAGVLSRPPRPW